MSRRSRRKKEKMLGTQFEIETSNSQETNVQKVDKADSSKKKIISFASTHKVQEYSHDGKKYGKILQFYDKHYKALLIIPIVLLILSFIQIGYQTYTTGDFIQKGITLKGGITIMVPTDKAIDQDKLSQAILTEFPKVDLGIRTLESTGTGVGYVIEADLKTTQETDKLLKIIETETGILESNYGIETIEPSLGSSFFKEVGIAMIVAFIFMAIVVFLAFRTFVPSFAAVFSVFADMVMTLAVVNLLGMKISSAGIAAFLMLIGYSVDTDILLSTRVLRREEGTVFDRIVGSIGTGMTMTASTIVAATAAILLTPSETLRQIMTIILIGLFMDIFNTWITNATIIRWYAEHRRKKTSKF